MAALQQTTEFMYDQPLLPQHTQLHELRRQLDAARQERAAAEETANTAEVARCELESEVAAVSQQVLDLDADLRASQVPPPFLAPPPSCVTRAVMTAMDIFCAI